LFSRHCEYKARLVGDFYLRSYTGVVHYAAPAVHMKLDRSTYEVLQIPSISLTDKTNLRELFNKTKFQNIKEHFRLNETNPNPVLLLFWLWVFATS
jgi:hypothetical protein